MGFEWNCDYETWKRSNFPADIKTQRLPLNRSFCYIRWCDLWLKSSSGRWYWSFLLNDWEIFWFRFAIGAYLRMNLVKYLGFSCVFQEFVQVQSCHL
jgi:hypothetical protein